MGDFKLIRLWGEGTTNTEHAYESSNLKDDISESNNWARKMPKKVKEMSVTLDRWLADTGALIPEPNPNYRCVSTSEKMGIKTSKRVGV
jgi:hypothetical protein